MSIELQQLLHDLRKYCLRGFEPTGIELAERIGQQLNQEPKLCNTDCLKTSQVIASGRTVRSGVAEAVAENAEK